MIKGLLKVIDAKQMEKLHEGALNVLQNTGMQIQGDFLLKALADAGCKVDFESKRVYFRQDLVEKQIAGQRDRYKMVRSSLWYPFCREMPKEDAAFPDPLAMDYGHAAPAVYDYPTGEFRSPTQNDQIEAIKLGNALEHVKAVCSPLICNEFDPRLETIESSRLLLLNTFKPGWVGTSSGKEVKFLAEMAALAVDQDKEVLKTQPPIFVHAYCTTSPLKLDKRSCDVLQEALRYKFPVNFAPMPILGGTTPVTPAGSVIMATAEILGCLTAATLIAPDIYYYATSISAEMDMKTTQICYATPAAVLTDAALHQLFRYRYGLVLNIEPAYVEAKCPGIQATFMKMFRQMTLAATASMPLPLGLLDSGAVFSPTQAMIDYDINSALYKFSCGIDTGQKAMAVDLINEMGFCEKEAYIQTEHTFDHFRDVLWDTQIFDRSYTGSKSYQPAQEDQRLLQKADRKWRDLVAEQKPVERSPEFIAEVDKIVTAARKELLV